MEYRNIDRYGELRQLRRAGDKAGLRSAVAAMSKQLNQRFYRLEKKGIQGSSYGYSMRQVFTGKEKPRYSESYNKLVNMDAGDLYEIALDVNRKLYSSSTTISGLYAMEERRLNRRAETLNEYGVDLSPDELKQFFELGGAEFLNSKYLDSVQILEDFVDMTKNGNLTPKEFLREFKRYRQRLQDGNAIGKVDIYGNVSRNLLRRSARKTNRQKGR